MTNQDFISREDKLRIIQESVPGKQITIAHIIANPDNSLYSKIGLEEKLGASRSAIGIITMTPSEAAIIASDIAIKTSGVELGFVDRITGTLIVTGSVSEVESSLNAIVEFSENKLGFSVCPITRT